MIEAKQETVGRIVHGEVMPHTPKIKLSSVESIRTEMAKVYREARSGRLETSEATRLVYILGQICKVYELEVIEGRITALESNVERRGRNEYRK